MSKYSIEGKIDEQREHEMDKATHLKELKKIFDELNIPFFLGYGMVLSAVRNGRFIFSDGDIDFIVREEDADLERIKKVLEETGHENFKEIDKNRLWCTKRVNGYESQFDLYIYPKHEAWRYEINGKEYWLFPKELFEEQLWIPFYGKMFPIPWFPEEYLRICYGHGWRIPHTQPRGTIPDCLKYRKLPTVKEFIDEKEWEEDK